MKVPEGWRRMGRQERHNLYSSQNTIRRNQSKNSQMWRGGGIGRVM